jgi:hypothetical protein
MFIDRSWAVQGSARRTTYILGKISLQTEKQKGEPKQTKFFYTEVHKINVHWPQPKWPSFETPKNPKLTRWNPKKKSPKLWLLEIATSG